MQASRFSFALILTVFLGTLSAAAAPTDPSPTAAAVPANLRTASTRTAATAALRRFSPNYADELQALRRWDKTNFTVFVARGGDDNATQRLHRSLVQRAMDQWQDATRKRLTFRMTPSAANADMVITFVPGHQLPEGVVGQTKVTFLMDTQLLTAAQTRISQDESDDLATQIATHELGHALGISGHSDDTHDLMYTHARLPVAITPRDLNTILWAYEDLLHAPAPGSNVGLIVSSARTTIPTRSRGVCPAAAPHRSARTASVVTDCLRDTFPSPLSHQR